MALILIMGFVILNMWFALAFTYGMGGVTNGKYLLGITLLSQHRKEREVQAILADYKREKRKLDVASLFLGLSVLLLNEWISIQFPCLMAWFGLSVYCYNGNLERYARKLYALKQEKGWLVGNPHIVRVDTELARVGEKGCVHPAWLLPAWLLAVLAFIALARSGVGSLRFVSLAIHLPLGLLATGFYFAIRSARPQVFCNDTQANQKLNSAYKREWSRVFVLLLYEIAFFALLSSWRASQSGVEAKVGFWRMETEYLMLFLAFALGSVLIPLLAHWRLKAVKEVVFRSLEQEQGEIYGDEDEYWLNGYPAGHRQTITEKRVGVGLTFNAGMKGGSLDKIVCGVIAAFTLLFSLFFLRYDFAQVSMEIEDGTCRVGAAGMGYRFNLEDVESVAWLEDGAPRMSKVSGLDSNRFYLGDFRVEDYGKCKVYLALKQKAVIRVETTDRTVWFNSVSRQQAWEFYQELLDSLPAQGGA